MAALAPFIVWFFYAGLTIGIIVIDGKRQREKAKAEGGVDFMDRSPWPYMALGLLCGPLPLIAYFGVTRKSGASGWLLGIGAAAGVFFATFIVSFVMQLAIR